MRIPSNKVNAVISFFKSELVELHSLGEIETFISYSFEHVLNYSKTDLLLNKDLTMSESELLKFNNIVKQLKKNKPIQYILGNTYFYGLNLNVNESVLIPRPETEELVDWIIKDYSNKKTTSLKLLDIGTGSGCIAIALSKNISESDVFALDVSIEALEIAKVNANKNDQKNIHFIEADINHISTLKSFNFPTDFDIIVSNPPYITESEQSAMYKNVLDYEPHVALFVKDTNPLIFYVSIANFAIQKLQKNGALFFEINELFGKEMIKMLLEKGFINIELRKDINGKDRMIKCIKP